MDKFTAIVPCYDNIEKHSTGKKISYQIFYSVQYIPMKDKLIYNIASQNKNGIITDFSTQNFSRYIPLFLPAVNALLGSSLIDKVVLLGDEKVIKQAFEYSGINPDVILVNTKESIGKNLISSSKQYDIDKHVFICMPDIPLITQYDVDRLINVYLESSDLQYHDLIVGFVPRLLYNEASDIDKKFIRLNNNLSENANDYYKESCGFLIRLSAFNIKLLDRIYYNRKLLLIPQQLASLVSDPKRITKVKMFAEYIIGKASVDTVSKNLSSYMNAKIKLVLHDVINFSIDGDSLEDIIKLSYYFK